MVSIPIKYRVELYWQGQWVPLPGEFDLCHSAEWLVAQWKQDNKVHSDPFRVVSVPQNAQEGK